MDELAASSLPEPVRQLPAEQRAQFVEFSNRVNADLNNPQQLDVVRKAFELKQGNVTFSANEQLDRVGNYLTLGGASTVDVAQVKDLYREHNITFDPNPVAVTYPVDLSGPRRVDAGTYDLMSIYASGNATGPREFISRPIDQAMIGLGQLVEKFARYVDDNPVAKYALMGLDVAAGPVAYGIRTALDQTIVGDALRTGQEKFVGYVADKLTVAGYSNAEGVSGGIGGVSLLGIGAYGFAGAMKNVGRLVDKVASGTLWTSTRNQTSVQNAYRHYKDHGEDFAVLNAIDYTRQAKDFLNNPPSGTLSKIRSNGDVIRFDPTTETFGVMDKTGKPRTFYKPDPAKHGYPTNMDYFNAQ